MATPGVSWAQEKFPKDAYAVMADAVVLVPVCMQLIGADEFQWLVDPWHAQTGSTLLYASQGG